MRPWPLARGAVGATVFVRLLVTPGAGAPDRGGMQPQRVCEHTSTLGGNAVDRPSAARCQPWLQGSRCADCRPSYMSAVLRSSAR